MEVFKHYPKCGLPGCGGVTLPIKIYNQAPPSDWLRGFRCQRCNEVFAGHELEYSYSIQSPCCQPFAENFEDMGRGVFWLQEDDGNIVWRIFDGDVGVIVLDNISHCPFCGAALPKGLSYSIT